MCHAAARSFGAFFALRFLLGAYASMIWGQTSILIDSMTGMCESCVAPILIVIISMFYKKDEQVKTSTSSQLMMVLISVDQGHTDILVLCDGTPHPPFALIILLTHLS